MLSTFLALLAAVPSPQQEDDLPAPREPRTFFVRGRCVAEENVAPLARVAVREIQRNGFDGRPARETTTGADGAFALPIDWHTNVVAFAVDGRVRRFAGVDFREQADELLGDVRLQVGYVVTCTVADPRGAPAAGLEVEVRDVPTEVTSCRGDPVVRIGAVTAADGTALLFLPAGVWRLREVGAARVLREPIVFRVPRADGAPVQLAFTVEVAAEIHGVVRDVDGKRLAEATVSASGGGSAVTNAIGEFALVATAPRRGVTWLRVRSRWQGTVAKVEAEWGDRDVKIDLPARIPATCSVTVVDPEGRRVPKFGLLLRLAEPPELIEWKGLYASERDAPEGRVVEETFVGEHFLRVVSHDPRLVSPPRMHVDVRRRDSIRVQLEAARPCRVRVQDENGAAIARAEVRLIRIHSYRDSPAMDPRRVYTTYLHGPDWADELVDTETDEHGEAVIHAPADTRRLRLEAAGRIVDAPDLRPDRPLDVVRAKGGRVAAQVALHGQQSRWFGVALFQHEDELRSPTYRPQSLYWEPTPVWTVEPGTYRVGLMHYFEPGGHAMLLRSTVQNVLVAAGEVTEARLSAQLPPPGRLEGTLLTFGASERDFTLQLVPTVSPNANTVDVHVLPDRSFVAIAPPGAYRVTLSRDGSAFEPWPGAKIAMGLLGGTLELRSGQTLRRTFVTTPRRLVVALRRPDGRPFRDWCEVDVAGRTLFAHGEGRLEFDPAPELPLRIRVADDRAPWSAPLTVPDDRREHAVTVTLVPPPR